MELKPNANPVLVKKYEELSQHETFLFQIVGQVKNEMAIISREIHIQTPQPLTKLHGFFRPKETKEAKK